MNASVGEVPFKIAGTNRRLIAFAAYALAINLGYVCAYLLRFEWTFPVGYVRLYWLTLPILEVIRLGCAQYFRLATSRWRFVSTGDIAKLAVATATGTVLFFLVTRVLPGPLHVPRSVVLFEAVLSANFVAGLWLTYRIGFEQMRRRRAENGEHTRLVIIIGAGEAGCLLAREIQRFPTGYRLVGMVDDDPLKQGTMLYGITVDGPTTDLRRIVARTHAEELIIAMPSATPAELRRIVERCEPTELPFKVLPGIAEVLRGDVRMQRVREVRIEDLLGREPIQLELPELADDLRGRTVLITGAAGSIGSELARQVALHEPALLVLLDQAETDLFYLEMDLRDRHPGLRIHAVVGDIVDAGCVERVFAEYEPERVYHAAAYKHVPMMEGNAAEAVRNNVIGTARVAAAAGRHRTEKFILISTDKAVRPSSVMGATKRLAELVVLELQEQFPDTGYAAVRFGNVLGSNGSVIPVFRRQLAAGKPLTVTDPEVTRFFMTIPEAVQLILQASLPPEVRGRIAMLEMGDPIRIAELARNLVRLSGKGTRGTPDIVFTGLRPGEKLHEELVAPDEECIPTALPKINLVLTHSDFSGSMLERVSEWERALEEGREAVVLSGLARLFPTVGPRLRAPRGVAEKVAAD